MSNELAVVVPYSDIERMALAIAKSGLFGIKTQDQAIALMLIAQAEGLHPAIAARDYHIVNGRPTLKADAMLARFQTAGGTVSWETINDQEVTAVFSHPKGGSARISWTIKMAKDAGLTGKDVWKQYPRQMLRARTVSEGIRTVFPGVTVGTYTPEEAVNFDDSKIVDAVPPKSENKTGTEKVKEMLKKEEAPIHDSASYESLTTEQYDALISALKVSTKDCSGPEKKEVMAEGLKLFGVLSIRDIPAERFEEALAWAKGNLPTGEVAP